MTYDQSIDYFIDLLKEIKKKKENFYIVVTHVSNESDLVLHNDTAKGESSLNIPRARALLDCANYVINERHRQLEIGILNAKNQN